MPKEPILATYPGGPCTVLSLFPSGAISAIDGGARLANLTIYDYHLVMKTTVRIAELKSRLSEYVRRVRRGQTITVLDRDTPVARLEPIDAAAARLAVREPIRGAPKPKDVSLPAPLRLKHDILRLLADERGTR